MQSPVLTHPFRSGRQLVTALVIVLPIMLAFAFATITIKPVEAAGTANQPTLRCGRQPHHGRQQVSRTCFGKVPMATSGRVPGTTDGTDLPRSGMAWGRSDQRRAPLPTPYLERRTCSGKALITICGGLVGAKGAGSLGPCVSLTVDW